MTTLTVPASLEEDASLRPVPWRRMAWVTWRQHRIALAGVAAFGCATPTPPRPPATRPHLPALT